jgi:hypothetical protein
MSSSSRKQPTFERLSKIRRNMANRGPKSFMPNKNNAQCPITQNAIVNGHAYTLRTASDHAQTFNVHALNEWLKTSKRSGLPPMNPLTKEIIPDNIAHKIGGVARALKNRHFDPRSGVPLPVSRSDRTQLEDTIRRSLQRVNSMDQNTYPTPSYGPSNNGLRNLARFRAELRAPGPEGDRLRRLMEPIPRLRNTNRRSLQRAPINRNSMEERRWRNIPRQNFLGRPHEPPPGLLTRLGRAIRGRQIERRFRELERRTPSPLQRVNSMDQNTYPTPSYGN